MTILQIGVRFDLFFQATAAAIPPAISPTTVAAIPIGIAPSLLIRSSFIFFKVQSPVSKQVLFFVKYELSFGVIVENEEAQIITLSS